MKILSYLLISLKYKGRLREPVIVKLNELVNLVYVFMQIKKLPKVLEDLGIAIISTSKGVMTNLKAKELGLVVKFYVIFGNLE